MTAAGEERTADARVASLDGLRAFAIILVVAHNAGSINGATFGLAMKFWSVVSNAGWIGVQLFFALSGFLITRILLDSKGAKGWLTSFYARRALRIFPLYYATLAFILLIAPHITALEPIAGRGARSSVWYWLYLSNWVAPFGAMAVALPHVWSLAVEEQFYLVWPALTGLLAERWLAWLCVALLLLSFAGRHAIHAAYSDPIAASAAYTWTITRSDAIAMGALVAILVRHESARAFVTRHVDKMLLASFAAILVTLAMFHGLPSQGPVAERFALPLTSVLSALIVFACVTTGRSLTARLMARSLSVRWLVVMGKYSYAIYVFHLPVHLLLRRYALARLEGGGIGAYTLYTLAVLAVSFGLSRISWAILEQPFLSLKRHVPVPSAAGSRG